jgi:hypothetical protein
VAYVRTVFAVYEVACVTQPRLFLRCYERARHPASFGARVIRATLCPAIRCTNIHRTAGAVAGPGSSRCAAGPMPRGPCSDAGLHRLAGTRTAAAA